MECPRCGKSGLSSNGICTNCIFELNQKKAENDGGKAGIPDADRADDPSVKGSQSDASEPTPAWRVELSKRLEALKQEKKLELGKQPPEKPTITQQAPAIQNKAPEKPAVIERPGGDTILSRKQKMESSSPTPSDAPQQKTIASLGEKVFNPPQQNQSKNIRDLIDSAVSRQAGQSIPESSIYVSEAPAEQENKYILLSRTLSGLIDLIIVVLCSTAFIIAADSFSGIINTDGVSVVEFILLFL
ncbi:MAG: hypothetical protein P8Z37_13810, partial [Acidobacteriota bacterium]